MWRLIKVVLFLVVLAGLAVVGNIYLGDQSAPSEATTTPLVIDVK